MLQVQRARVAASSGAHSAQPSLTRALPPSCAQMGEYSARQQLKLSAIEDDVKANQQVTGVNRVAAEKRQLKDMHARLVLLNDSQKETLSDADLARVQEIQKQLGVTPRGGIYAAGVREVRLFKEAQNTRLGIIFHQSTPEGSDVSSDYTPRAAGGEIILPVIKVLDKSGIAGACPTSRRRPGALGQRPGGDLERAGGADAPRRAARRPRRPRHHPRRVERAGGAAEAHRAQGAQPAVIVVLRCLGARASARQSDGT